MVAKARGGSIERLPKRIFAQAGGFFANWVHREGGGARLFRWGGTAGKPLENGFFGIAYKPNPLPQKLGTVLERFFEADKGFYRAICIKIATPDLVAFYSVSSLFLETCKPCPRRESNSNLRFRKPLFYPLNYGDA